MDNTIRDDDLAIAAEIVVDYFNRLYSEVAQTPRERRMQEANALLNAAFYGVEWEYLNVELVNALARSLFKDFIGPLEILRVLVQRIISAVGFDNYRLLRQSLAVTIHATLGDSGSEGLSQIPRDVQKQPTPRPGDKDVLVLFQNDPWLVPLYIIFLSGESRFDDFHDRYAEHVSNKRG